MIDARSQSRSSDGESLLVKYTAFFLVLLDTSLKFWTLCHGTVPGGENPKRVLLEHTFWHALLCHRGPSQREREVPKTHLLEVKALEERIQRDLNVNAEHCA